MATQKELEAKELILVGKVELKIALAETEIALQKVLATFLAPLLLKLASDSESVRQKVIAVCQHINTRIKSSPVQLPVKALLSQFVQRPDHLIRHFDLLYVQHGLDRLPLSERIELLPLILRNFATLQNQNGNHGATCFNLFLRILCNMPLLSRGFKDDQVMVDTFSSSENSEDANAVVRCIGRFLLFLPGSPSGLPCPGLNKEEYDFFQLQGKAGTWDSSCPGGLNLTEAKICALRFVTSAIFPAHCRIPPALFASADSNSKISELGEDALKKEDLSLVAEDSAFVISLFSLYLGDTGPQGHLPVTTPLKIKILAFLSRSKIATSHLVEASSIIRQGLIMSEDSTRTSAGGKASIGLQITKLRTQIFGFTNWISRMADPNELSPYSASMIRHLQGFIAAQGVPESGSSESFTRGDASCRSFAYESIGQLAVAGPDHLLVEPKLELLDWLFASLREDSYGSDVSLSIEQAISGTIRKFENNLNQEMESKLATFCEKQVRCDINDCVRSPRLVAIKLANRCLPFSNVEARYIDLCALIDDGHRKREVVEEGKRGLDPFWSSLSHSGRRGTRSSGSQETQELDYPRFTDLVRKFYSPQAPWSHSKDTNLESQSAALTFCRFIIFRSLLADIGRFPTVNQEWQRNIDTLIANDESVRSKVAEVFRTQLNSDKEFNNAVSLFLEVLVKSTGSGDQKGLENAGQFFLDFANLLPMSMFSSLGENVIRLIEPMLNSLDQARRIGLSRLFGLLSVVGDTTSPTQLLAYDTLVKNLESWKNVSGKESLRLHGCIHGTAQFLARHYRIKRCSIEISARKSSWLIHIKELLQGTTDPMLIEAAYVSMAELLLWNAITVNDFDQASLSSLKDKLIEAGKKGNENAISSLGILGMQSVEVGKEGELSATTIVNALHEMHSIRGAEIQFAIGEALTWVTLGWESKALVPRLGALEERPHSQSRKSIMPQLTDRVLEDCTSTKPSLRQAATIWLLCLVQYCGHNEEIQERLPQCQLAFKRVLSDRDTLTQETAARGLSMLYEKGGKELKEDLVRDLIGSFTGQTTSMAGSVSADTQLFEPGALPTGDGSITTYKDIMSLAAEVGDTSLVYRFMSLASHEAIWSSRAAFGRFGLSSILGEADTEGYFSDNPKLIPALFRYRFDPNPNVRRAMNDIWVSLVKDPSTIINLKFDAIIEDLFRSILTKEWRTRQASCAALADLISGRPLEYYEKHLNEIWRLTFKVCDDIKESVRASAMTLARALTSILVRALESGDASSKSAQKMLNQILPFLLGPQGLESSAPDVQTFSRQTVLEIIKKANGSVLNEYLPDLIARLLALLSSIEPEMVNYLHMNAETFGTTKEELDNARLRNIRGSPMLEAIERCLDFLDENTMSRFRQPLEDSIKTVIGLPSRVGCSRVLVSLSTRKNFIFKPFADSFLKLAYKQLFDRSDTISSAYAASCGYIARLASDQAILVVIRQAEKLYLSSDEDRERYIAGDLLQSLGKHATDRFRALATDALPLVFLGKHDQIERVREIHESTWNDNVGGSRTVLLYLREIVALTQLQLDSPKWAIKHASAFAIADATVAAGKTVSESDALLLWTPLCKALQGKTWEGKEKVLSAFIVLASSKFMDSHHSSHGDECQSIMLREAKRQNLRYQQHAIRALADFVKIDCFRDIYKPATLVCESVIEKICAGDETIEMDVDGGEGKLSSSNVKDQTLVNALMVVFRCVHPQTSALERETTSSLTALNNILCIILKTDQAHLHGIRLTVFDEMKATLLWFLEIKLLVPPIQGKEITDNPSHLESALRSCIATIIILHSADNAEPLRIKAAEMTLVFAKVALKSTHLQNFARETVHQLSTLEPSKSVMKSLDEASGILGD